MLSVETPKSASLATPSLLSKMLAALITHANIVHLKSNVVNQIRNYAASSRQQLVILGTGWGGFALLKNIDKRKYDVIVVSPRNHFLFTPLLPSTTVGTLEFRSIIDPIRNHGFRDEKHFHLAEATDVDFQTKTLQCRSILEPSLTYQINYDKLAICVGAMPNTFGVPGVRQHAYFLKVYGLKQYSN